DNPPNFRSLFDRLPAPMIGRLTGILVEKNPPQLMLDEQGVGYRIDVAMSTFSTLPGIGERMVLFTHLVVREDAHLLFGFGSESERRAFRQLIRITSVGARLAHGGVFGRVG